MTATTTIATEPGLRWPPSPKEARASRSWQWSGKDCCFTAIAAIGAFEQPGATVGEAIAGIIVIVATAAKLAIVITRVQESAARAAVGR